MRTQWKSVSKIMQVTLNPPRLGHDCLQEALCITAMKKNKGKLPIIKPSDNKAT